MIGTSVRMNVEKGSDGTIITIPSSGRIPDIGLSLIWCILWPIGILVIPRLQILPQFSAIDVIVKVVILVAWVAAWAAGIWKIVYWFLGKETIHIRQGVIEYHRGAIGLGQHRTIETATVRKSRLSPKTEWIKDYKWPSYFGLRDGGSVSLHIGNKTFRMGRNLSDEQAKQLLEFLPNQAL